MTTSIFCVGANHRTAGIGEREAFYLTPDELGRALPVVRERHQLQELFVLSTCNRFELIGVSDAEKTPDIGVSIDAWIDLHAVASSRAQIDRAALVKAAYNLSGRDAIRHAFMVAASLDSMVLGETQITGQFKDALQLATSAKTLGPLLGRLGQEALATAKKVRSQTDIGKRTVSLSHAAVALAKRMYHDLSQCRFLIVGAGEMARVAAEHASSYKPLGLTVANRTQARAYELIQHLGIGEAHSLENLPHLLARADVVIAATGAAEHVITHDMVSKALKERDAGAPLFLVDIALPRDIDPECAAFDDVYLFDLDDLKQMIDQHMNERKIAAEEAALLVDDATNQFDQWLATQAVTPAISEWRTHVQSTLEREVAKTLSRELFSGLSTSQRQAMTAMIEAVTSRLTADVAQLLRRTPQNDAAILAAAISQHLTKLSSSNRGSDS